MARGRILGADSSSRAACLIGLSWLCILGESTPRMSDSPWLLVLDRLVYPCRHRRMQPQPRCLFGIQRRGSGLMTIPKCGEPPVFTLLGGHTIHPARSSLLDSVPSRGEKEDINTQIFQFVCGAGERSDTGGSGVFFH